VGENGGFRAEGGERSDNLGHVDVGSSGILGGSTSSKAGGSNGDSETHFGGMKVVINCSGCVAWY